jgi:hypothetical protein
MIGRAPVRAAPSCWPAHTPPQPQRDRARFAVSQDSGLANQLAARSAARYAGIQASSAERTILSHCVLPWFPLGRRATGGSLTRRRRDDSDVSPSAATHPVGACRRSRIDSVRSTATQPCERSQAQCPAPRELFGIPPGKGLTVPDNVVLIMRFHPVGGEDVSVMSEDFTGEHEALEAVARALDERRSLVLRHARYDREADENGVIINLANVVSVRVSTTDSAATGQYL